MLRVQRAEAGGPVWQTNEESLFGKLARRARQELDKRWQSLWLPRARRCYGWNELRLWQGMGKGWEYFSNGRGFNKGRSKVAR